MSFLSWLNAGLNVVLLVVLVPPAAEVGAASAMLATQALGTALVLVLYFRLGQTGPRSALVVQPDDIKVVRDQALGLIRR